MSVSAVRRGRGETEADGGVHMLASFVFAGKTTICSPVRVCPSAHARLHGEMWHAFLGFHGKILDQLAAGVGVGN